jgi:hypothetical protein
MVITPEEGDRLRERLREGASLRLEVEIESRDFAGRIPLITTRVGPAQAPEVLVTAHLCHPLPSANDNASGAAATLEIARVLALLHRSGRWTPRNRAVRFLWMPELTGTHAWLRDPERTRRLVAALNLDMVGQSQTECGSTFLLEHPPCFAASFAEDLLGRIRAEAPDWVGNYSGPGHYSMTRMAEVPYAGGSDHIVYIDPALGVPCPMLIQWPDRFYHSSLDTVDHTDPESLALAVRCGATYAGFLAAAGETEAGWILRAVERGARSRLLLALDRADAGRGVARETVRGAAAIRSCARLGISEERLSKALHDWQEFASAEGGAIAGPAATSPAGERRVATPRRRIAAPLDFQIHLLPGYEALPESDREELRLLRARFPGESTVLDVAWYVCDGRRDLEQIAALVGLESGLDPPALGSAPGDVTLERFFLLTERLGISDWNREPG